MAIAADSNTSRVGDTRSIYRKRYEKFTGYSSELRKRARIIGHLRLVSFLLFAVGLVAGFWQFSKPQIIWLSVGGVALIVYIFLVIHHSFVYRKLHRAQGLARLNEEAEARFCRFWTEIPCPSVPPEYEQSPTSRDLDIFGRASLMQLVGPIHLPEGRKILAGWFLNAAPVPEIKARQEAVAELAPELDHRQEFAYRSRESSDMQSEADMFLRWAEGDVWIGTRPALFRWVWALLGIELLLIVLHATAIVTYPIWILMIVGNLIFTRFYMKPIHAIFVRAGSRRRIFRSYAELLMLIEGFEFSSSLLVDLKKKSRVEGHDAASELTKLDRLIHLSEVRQSGMLYGFMQGVFLWDFHVLKRLEQWQMRNGLLVRRWIEVPGEYEALSAMSSLAHDHENWAFPDIRDDQRKIITTGLGHPLIEPEICIKNDVIVGPPGSFLLVTGSNMSGKSTLLRALGMNVILALAGGPVCAESMALCPVVLGTSFRIRDSLSEGISYYMAELLRLKDIVALAKDESSSLLLYLFDEILMGTNIVERQSAVRRVIRFLVDKGSIGVLATHDLTIADARELREACRPVHFTEQFVESEGGDDMVFDYILRHGVAKSSNALKMLKMVDLVEAQ